MKTRDTKVLLAASAAAVTIALILIAVFYTMSNGRTESGGITISEKTETPKKPETTITTGEASIITYGTNIYSVPQSETKTEMRAIWVPYMSIMETTPQKLDTIVANCRRCGANAIIFHVRPFGDAVYRSDFFPWSHILTETQGKDPGFDPLEYMVKKAHENGMELHAWINPLRIKHENGGPYNLSANNPYTIWRNDGDPSNDDWVIDYNGGKFYNPAIPEVRSLLCDGMVELAAKYDIDGIHWDDYFYPAADSSFDDSRAYNDYRSSGGTMDLLAWRSENINTLIRESYSRVKATDSSCSFGISPAGNIQNCLNMGADVYKWCSSGGYIDYICPQIYWTFESKVAPFDKRCEQWRSLVTNQNIKFYVGLALYKAGSSADNGQWLHSSNIIARQIEFARSEKINADGYMIFSYDYLDCDQTRGEMENLMALLAL